MDIQLLASPARFEVPLLARVAFIVAVWGAAAVLVGFLAWTRPRDTWTGPPIQIDFGGFNSQGDRAFNQPLGHYDPSKPLYGIHPVVVWNPYYRARVVCADVFHNVYANEAAARAGVVSDPGRYVMVHPKVGQRGCWHILGVVPEASDRTVSGDSIQPERSTRQ